MAGSPTVEIRTIRTPDGRSLEVRTAGPADGDVLLFHHGSPGAGVPPAGLVEALTERGLRYVAGARPGYAGSTRLAGRGVADVAPDAAAVLDDLGVDRCFTMGESGGGPHTLACAVLIPERIRAATSIAGVAPFDADGLDWLAGMGRENVAEFGATAAGPAELRAYLEREAAAFGNVSGDEVVAAFGDLVGDADRAVLTGDYGESVAEDIRTALAAGIWGWHDDDLAFVAPWGFDLDAIPVPVDIWQGGQDRMVPSDHGVWLSTHVRGADVQAHLLPEHGHLSLAAASIGEILDTMLSRPGVQP
jgi:pimeloyl-ACP methyl ester carboxylesterase